MTRILTTLLILAAFAFAGESADDLRLYRQRYVKQGQPDPAAEFKAAVNAGKLAWDVDVKRARAFEKAGTVKIRTDDKLGSLRVTRIFPRITKAAGPRYATVRAKIYRSNDINAFTVGGDRIYIADQLLRSLNDEELAAVLAHELSHIVARHSFRKRALGKRLKVPAAERSLALQLYSRICEAEADAYATVLLKKAGLPVVTTHFELFAKLRPNGNQVNGRLVQIRSRIMGLEREEGRLEAAFSRSRSEQIFAKLAKVKQQLTAARVERDRLNRARAFLRLTSEHTHPDAGARARFFREAAAGTSNDAVIRYVVGGRSSASRPRASAPWRKPSRPRVRR